MADAQVELRRKRLEQFLVDLLEPVGRSERRHWGSVYARDLLFGGDLNSILPATHSPRRLARLAKCRWKIEQDRQQLKEELGLDHHEGRNWAGWHHHVTLVMLAHGLLRLEALRSKKQFWVDLAEDAS